MAQLKDALVTGDVRVLGKLYANQSLPDGVFHLANISGTAAVTTSPYSSSKWQTTVNDPRITSLYSGLTISLKIPVAGNSTYGTMLDVNGLGYHPVVYNVNSNISTRYSVGGTIILTYNATQTASGYDAVASATTYTGCWQLEDYDYDSTNIYQLRDNNAAIAVASNAGSLYRYEICFTNKACQLVPYNNTSNARTTYTKTLNSAAFDPFGPIYYYNSTTTVSAGSNAGASTLYYHVNIDSRYSMNILDTGTAGSTALTSGKPIYVVATYDATTGLATLVNNTSATSYLDRSSIVQELPETDLSGKILIYLGRASSLYQLELSPVHTVYKWNNGVSAWMPFAASSDASSVNGHYVYKDVPADAVFTDNNTTYSFANGTNGFTVTPSGGTAQTVTVTPSITNNITGSGTSGYLAKYNGANSLTNGPQIGSSTTTYLRNNGTWADPKNVYVGTSAPSASNYEVWIDPSATVDKTALINMVYPIGSIYISVNATNPGSLLGVGTWVAFSTGRTLIGVGSNGTTNYSTVEATGGSEGHVHDMSNHTHTSAAHTHSLSDAGYACVNPSYQSANLYVRGVGVSAWTETWVSSLSSKARDSTDTSTRGAALRGRTDSTTPNNTGGPSTNSTGSGSSIQPYITVYMWKRTA